MTQGRETKTLKRISSRMRTRSLNNSSSSRSNRMKRLEKMKCKSKIKTMRKEEKTSGSRLKREKKRYHLNLSQRRKSKKVFKI